MDDLTSLRYSVLTFDKVERLDNVMDSTMPIHGRGNFPTLQVRLKDLVQVVRTKLAADGVTVRDIRLNGGAAGYVLSSDEDEVSYTDLDLIFGVDLSNHRNFDKVRTAVLDSLLDFLPEGVNRKKMTSCTLKEAYVHKMVKVAEGGDKWSLISLCNNYGRDIEIKFVDTMKRQFEFSVDSFQIILDSLLSYYECNDSEKIPMTSNLYPTVVGESKYGDFNEAIHHMQERLIATRKPEEIRGGGLLKYCRLQVQGFTPVNPDEIRTMEKYMCSRFFIDFSDVNVQRIKLTNYLMTHFHDDLTKYSYLMILHKVVDQSTVCLMGHERRQTLSLIEEMALQYYYLIDSSNNNSTSSSLVSSRNGGSTSPAPSTCSTTSSSSHSNCSNNMPLLPVPTGFHPHPHLNHPALHHSLHHHQPHAHHNMHHHHNPHSHPHGPQSVYQVMSHAPPASLSLSVPPKSSTSSSTCSSSLSSSSCSSPMSTSPVLFHHPNPTTNSPVSSATSTTSNSDTTTPLATNSNLPYPSPSVSPLSSCSSISEVTEGHDQTGNFLPPSSNTSGSSQKNEKSSSSSSSSSGSSSSSSSSSFSSSDMKMTNYHSYINSMNSPHTHILLDSNGHVYYTPTSPSVSSCSTCSQHAAAGSTPTMTIPHHVMPHYGHHRSPIGHYPHYHHMHHQQFTCFNCHCSMWMPCA